MPSLELRLALLVYLTLAAVPATAYDIVVTTTEDQFDEIPDDQCSLREGLQTLNTTIPFGGCELTDLSESRGRLVIPPGVYELTRGPGEGFLEGDNSVGDLDFNAPSGELARTPGATPSGLPVLAPDRIEGAGSDSTIIRRAPGSEPFRILQMDPRGSEMILRGVTLSGGESPLGGGLFAQGGVVLDDVHFVDNVASGPDASGGGFYVIGPMFLSDSEVRDNRVVITSCTGVGGGGGGRADIQPNVAFDLSLGIDGSTFAGNVVETTDPSCRGLGGGLLLRSSVRDVPVDTSTFSGNTAPEGGGLAVVGSTEPAEISLRWLTMADNSATVGAGGLRILDTSLGEVSVEGLLIAGNFAPVAPDCSNGGAPLVVTNNNLLSVDQPIPGELPCLTGPLVGTTVSPVDARLGPLADNGGPTRTHALLPGSPAIDAAAGPATGFEDQRGVERPQGAAWDLGAFEATGGLAAVAAIPTLDRWSLLLLITGLLGAGFFVVRRLP